MAGALDKLFREDGQEEDQRPEESSSDESSGSLPIGLDDEYKEEDEAIEKIMQDDTLDEPAKIDLIAEERGWFHSDTTIIDAFMAGELDAAAAAEKLAEPIDETYSTADHNRALYTEERVARTQRIYHSREKALEMWGAEEDIAEPSPETVELPSTEMQLWILWYSVLHAAKRILWTDEARQEKLLSLVKILKARPDPPLPYSMSVPLKRNWIWASGTLWSSLNMLGPSARESWNDSCGCGAGWTILEQHAWTNVNAFVARLTVSETSNFVLYGMWALRDALESKPGSSASHHRNASLATQQQLLVTVAAVWIRIAGKYMYGFRSDKAVPKDVEVRLDAREKKLPWWRGEETMFCTARWHFWRRRFEQEAQNEDVSEETRELAEKSAEIIRGLLSTS